MLEEKKIRKLFEERSMDYSELRMEVKKMFEEKTKYKEMNNLQNRREINESFENRSNRAELSDKPKKDGNTNSD